MSTYTVQPGDNLSTIASRYGVPTSSLSGYSSGNPNLIYPGEQLSVGNTGNMPNTSTRNGSVFTPPPTSSLSFSPVPNTSTKQGPVFTPPPSAPAQNFSQVPNTSTKQGPAFTPPTTFAKQPQQNFTPVPDMSMVNKTEDTQKPNWLSQQMDNISNTLVPKAYADTGSRATQSQNPEATATQATAQALKNGANPSILDQAKKFLGAQDYIGLCEAFVERATKGVEGIYSSAIDAWNKQLNKAQTDMSAIKPGDAVYFAPDASNGYNGHTGVYVGNNQFISATYDGIKQVDLNDWTQSTGQKLLGYIPSAGSGAGDMVGNFAKNAVGFVQQGVQNLGKAFAQPAMAAEHTNMPVSTPGFVNGTPDWVKNTIKRAAEKYNIPTMLLSALLKQESGFNPNPTSPAGAVGIAQFMPETAKGMGVDPMDPESAIMGAAQYLRRSWDKFGKPELALAAYNAGGAAVNQFGGIPPYKETQDYVKNIMAMAGELHQSANGPFLNTFNEIKKQAKKINKPGSGKGKDITSLFHPQFQSPIPMGDIVSDSGGR